MIYIPSCRAYSARQRTNPVQCVRILLFSRPVFTKGTNTVCDASQGGLGLFSVTLINLGAQSCSIDYIVFLIVDVVFSCPTLQLPRFSFPH